MAGILSENSPDTLIVSPFAFDASVVDQQPDVIGCYGAAKVLQHLPIVRPG